MSVSKPKHQHTDRTLKEKIEILGKLDSGLKAVDVCKRFNIGQSMLSTWKKQRAKINEMVDAGKVLNQKCNVNPSCLKWRGHCIFGFVK